jgi:hypothetical protein
MAMILDELEAAYRHRASATSEKQVIVSMHLGEDAVRVLKPRLEAADLSLSEFVRHLIGLKVRELS